MPEPVIVGAVRTAIGRSFKGTLVNTPPETLITAIVPEVIRRAGIDPDDIDDMIFAESHYGGGDLARYAADACGLKHVPGQSVNRHCAGSLTAIGNASAQIGSGMERVLIAGGVQSLSMTPLMSQRIIGPELKFEERWMPPTHVETPDAPTKDMSITVGWNTAQAAGISREEMDAWAARSHQRAIAAIDAGKFLDEILPLKVQQLDGSVVDFSVDEQPRRDSTAEKLAALKVLHPEIEGFSITAGNASGTNDACAAVALVDRAYALDKDLDVMATVKAWAAVGVRSARHRPGRRRGDRQGARPRRAQAVGRGAVGDQRGLRVGADRRLPQVRARRGAGELLRQRLQPGPPDRGVRRPDDHHARLRVAPPRRRYRRGGDVRRRRSGRRGRHRGVAGRR